MSMVRVFAAHVSWKSLVAHDFCDAEAFEELVVAAVVWVDEGIGEGEEEEEDARAGERTGEVIRGRADGDADVEEEDMDCGVRANGNLW